MAVKEGGVMYLLMVKKLKIVLVCLYCLFILIACGATIPFQTYAPTSDSNAVVYVYRPYRFAGSMASPKVYLSDQDLGVLNAGTYLVTEIPPGEHEFLIGKKGKEWVNWAPDTIQQRVNFDAGKVYYFRMSLDLSDVSMFVIPMGYVPTVMSSGTARVKFDMMEPEKAFDEIQKTNPANTDDEADEEDEF
ncbi:DUF2846 domain-containing protein [Teredinibacter sp. KSP-S5-2]|uniref:DUF2846 domain-containing protein n=1 Tax=Teredinibacter sp. KSP-S5-2 TaxID=3034506 RepID=UPI002934C855|nr:DUF2846 domain-containing protein [Teredinibacter sp. KSP-S5-2]WNO09375.1 DUF2846 domain-containing protein [Teredinibacter sp. KSP-S5-2]